MIFAFEVSREYFRALTVRKMLYPQYLAMTDKFNMQDS